jgi:hypothetical protein
MRMAELPEPEIGRVEAGTLEGARTVVLRPSADHYLLLIDCDGAAAACSGLLRTGRSIGLSLIGCDAVSRLAVAARRPVPTT